MTPALSSGGRVTVITPAYNASKFVCTTIESVLAQTRAAHEIIVVNDGSTDATASVLEPYRDRIIYLSQANQGMCRTRNNALAHATGDWILFLDADDVIAPLTFEALLGDGRGENTDQVVYGDVVDIDERGDTLRTRPAVDFTGPSPEGARRLFAMGSIPPGAFLVPRRLLERVGSFDPRFAYAGDLDLWLRCGAYVPFVHVAHPTLLYRVHGDNFSHRGHVAVNDNIDVRVHFQDWCKARDLTVFDREWTEADLIDRFLLEHFYGRSWSTVDLFLEVARERGVSSPAIRKVRASARLPKWLFRLRDYVTAPRVM